MGCRVAIERKFAERSIIDHREGSPDKRPGIVEFAERACSCTLSSEGIMSEKDDTQLTSISKARTLEEIADFWDAHSLANYWDQIHEVEFEVRAKRRAAKQLGA